MEGKSLGRQLGLAEINLHVVTGLEMFSQSGQGQRSPRQLVRLGAGDTGRLLATFPSLGVTLQLEEGGSWQAFMKTETPERDFPVQVGLFCYL